MLLSFSLSVPFPQQKQVIYNYMTGVVIQTNKITDMLKWMK